MTLNVRTTQTTSSVQHEESAGRQSGQLSCVTSSAHKNNTKLSLVKELVLRYIHKQTTSQHTAVLNTFKQTSSLTQSPEIITDTPTGGQNVLQGLT
jgi:hypothetical protein